MLRHLPLRMLGIILSTVQQHRSLYGFQCRIKSVLGFGQIVLESYPAHAYNLCG